MDVLTKSLHLRDFLYEMIFNSIDILFLFYYLLPSIWQMFHVYGDAISIRPELLQLSLGSFLVATYQTQHHPFRFN